MTTTTIRVNYDPSNRLGGRYTLEDGRAGWIGCEVEFDADGREETVYGVFDRVEISDAGGNVLQINYADDRPQEGNRPYWIPASSTCQGMLARFEVVPVTLRQFAAKHPGKTLRAVITTTSKHPQGWQRSGSGDMPIRSKSYPLDDPSPLVEQALDMLGLIDDGNWKWIDKGRDQVFYAIHTEATEADSPPKATPTR